MADADEPQPGKPKRLDRRALLLGAAAGAAGATAIGAGIVGVREKARALVTPAALPAGRVTVAYEQKMTARLPSCASTSTRARQA